RVREPLGPGHQRAERTVGRAVAREPQIAAEVGQPFDAWRAPTAGTRRVDGDALARARARLDGGDELVAEHEWFRQHGVADRSLYEPVPVGSAEPDRADPQENLARCRLRSVFVVQA